MWEALDKAAYYGLSNLIAIVDVNRLGQSGPTELGWDLDAYARRAEAFGARVLVVDGHDLERDRRGSARHRRHRRSRPTVVLAKHHQGQGFREVEDRDGWHGKPFPAEMADRAIAELGGERDLVVRGPGRPTRRRSRGSTGPARRPALPRGTPWATRWPPARRTATRSIALGGATPADGRAGRRGRATRPTRTEFAKAYRRAILRDVHRRAADDRGRRDRAQRARATSRSPRRSRRSCPGRTTSSGWRRSPAPTSAWSARTPGSRSAPTGRPRWRSRTWR